LNCAVFYLGLKDVKEVTLGSVFCLLSSLLLLCFCSVRLFKILYWTDLTTLLLNILRNLYLAFT